MNIDAKKEVNLRLKGSNYNISLTVNSNELQDTFTSFYVMNKRKLDHSLSRKWPRPTQSLPICTCIGATGCTLSRSLQQGKDQTLLTEETTNLQPSTILACSKQHWHWNIFTRLIVIGKWKVDHHVPQMESSDLETSNLHMHRNYRMHFVKEFTIEEQTLLTEEHTNLQPSTILLSKIVRSPRASGNLLCSLRTNLVIVIRSVRMASAA